MKRFLFGLLAASLATSALAADLPRAPVLKAPSIITTPGGLYVGAFIGGGATKEHFDFVSIPGSGSLHPTGVQVGAKVGYAVWMGGLSIGAEADVAYDLNLRKQSNPCGAILMCESKGSWLLTQRAVIGWVLGSGARAVATGTPDQWPVPISLPASFAEAKIIPYITGGVAERRITAKVVGLGQGEEWLVGWVAGGGVRIPVSQAVSFDLSYLYIGYNKNFVPATSAPIFPTFRAQSEQVARVALTLGY